MDLKENIILEIREDILTKVIDVNIESTSIAQKEAVFFDNTVLDEKKEKDL